MKREDFENTYQKVLKMDSKIMQLTNELAEKKELIAPYIQFYRPLITISSLKNKYWHCNSPIVINGKMNRHSVYLGIKEKFEGKNDKRLIQLAENKMGELLRKKYPHMFE